ncbi:tripartite tricarboxylate transporter substrate-binding protein [Pigmentiphaga sp. YJ18]|uniref:Bug family tripartite tricarboxylate transporter substrate binding protein n=1 Tax=unclassified Pigmentiphaga TaxID=2626614 RepID=UPI001375A381|nr:tripartite tricarboxylate transporter substrate-binding protein [Pigmentiphaga sp. H8]
MRILARFRAWLAVLLLGAGAAHGAYPDHAVRLVVPFSAGGQFDIVARLFAKYAGERLGQPVVVENVGGGGGNIGAAKVANAAADGYTLLTLGGNHTMAKAIYANPGFALEDFAPIALISASPHVVLANAAAPFKTMQEMVAYAKRAPGKLSYGSPGVGSSMHLTFEMIKHRYGLDIVHVPYRGGANALSDLAGGQVQLGIVAIAPAMEFIKAGRIRALAVTSGSRSGVLPDVPALAEIGYPELDAASWMGLAAPARTPAAVVDRWNAVVLAFQRDPAVAAQLQEMGFRSRATTPQEFKAYIDAEAKAYTEVVRRTGIRAD